MACESDATKTYIWNFFQCYNKRRIRLILIWHWQRPVTLVLKEKRCHDKGLERFGGGMGVCPYIVFHRTIHTSTMHTTLSSKRNATLGSLAPTTPVYSLVADYQFRVTVPFNNFFPLWGRWPQIGVMGAPEPSVAFLLEGSVCMESNLLVAPFSTLLMLDSAIKFGLDNGIILNLV